MSEFEPKPGEEEKPVPDAEGVSFSAALNGKKTVFVKHPCDPAVKRKIVNTGHRILDASFAPRNATIFDGMTGKPVGGETKGKGKAPAKEGQ